MANAGGRIQELEHIKDTVDTLATLTDGSETKLMGSKDISKYLENKSSKQSNKLHSEDAAAIGHQEHVVVLEK